MYFKKKNNSTYYFFEYQNNQLKIAQKCFGNFSYVKLPHLSYIVWSCPILSCLVFFIVRGGKASGYCLLQHLQTIGCLQVDNDLLKGFHSEMFYSLRPLIRIILPLFISMLSQRQLIIAPKAHLITLKGLLQLQSCVTCRNLEVVFFKLPLTPTYPQEWFNMISR